MEKITTKTKLIEMIKNELAVEKLARDRYEKESHSFTNKEIVSTLGKIKKDEDRHVDMLEGLIELLEK